MVYLINHRAAAAMFGTTRTISPLRSHSCSVPSLFYFMSYIAIEATLRETYEAGHAHTTE